MEMERLSPLKKAVWLVEYVSRMKGAEHLKISSRHLSLAQYLLLDQAFFVAVILLIMYCFCKKIGQRVLAKKKISKSLTDKKDV